MRFGIRHGLFLATCALSSSAWAGPLEEGRAALEALDVDRARPLLSAALAAAETDAKRAEVRDLLGIVEGISTRYGSAFRQFYLAAKEAGAEAVTGVEHPQLATRLIAECATRYALAQVDLPVAEAELRRAVGAPPGSTLDGGALREALFDDRFSCPRSGVAAPVAGVTPTAPLPEVKTSGPPAMTWVLGAAGVLATGTGAVLGGLAQAQVEGASATSFAADVEGAEAQLTGANIAFGVAGAAAVAAILVWVFDEGDATSAEPPALGVRF